MKIACAAMLLTLAHTVAHARPIRTGNLTVEIGPHGVSRLTNRLTGETYAESLPGARLAPELHRAGEAGPWSPDDASDESVGKSGVRIRMTRRDDRLTTRLRALPDGAVEVKQDGAGGSAGLYGLSWSLGIIPDRYELLVPGNSGQRFGKDAPVGTRSFDYPLGWEAGFVLIQGARGGVLIQANDPTMSPKRADVERVRGGFRLRLMSQSEAPFDQRTRISGKPWLIRAYKGPWQVGAAMYRAWAEKNLGLKPLSPLDGPGAIHRTPHWAAGIRFVAIVGMDIETIRLLARRVVPRQTLLYVPGWRRDGYDRNYPDYTPAPGFGPFVAAAKQLGFRVMPHVNYFGCDPKNPEYERFRRFHMRDPFTKERLWWDWKMAEPPIKFAYINPASREWRKLFVERMTALCRQYDIDALHLDQTLCIFNDANGRIDGMSCAEGNLALHRELKRALPNVALSGEGLNEVTCRFEEFAQRHVYGLDHVGGTWDDRLLNMAHPIASAVLAPYTTIYGYLGLPNPERAPELADAWQRAYERFGVIPTYAWPERAQLAARGSMEIERLLRRGSLFMRYGLVPDFRPNWSPDDIFVWRLPQGGRVRYRQGGGTALEMRLPGAKPVILERRLEGIEQHPGGGSVAGWPAYNERGIIGLHPKRRYVWTPEPHDMNRPHLSSLPSGWHVTRSGQHADLLRIGLAAHGGNAAFELPLWDEAALSARKGGGVRVSCGIIAVEGRTPSAVGLTLLDETSGGLVRPDGEGLFFHPPYKNVPTQALKRGTALTFAEYRIELPDAAGLRLQAGAHLRSGAADSDGVRFRVSAWLPDQPTDRQSVDVLATGVQPVPVELDLARFRGRPITLRIEADAGPAGNPSYDWGRLSKPTISADPDRANRMTAVLRFAGLPTAVRALAADGEPKVEMGGNGTARVVTTLPNVLLLPFGNPLRVAETGLDFMTQPLRGRTRSESGVEGPQSIYPPDKGAAACGGIQRAAISLHPPNMGCSLLDYDLVLPATPMKLVTAIGIRDGSKSNGVGFRVEVNGKTVFSRDIRVGTGWMPIEVDLAAYRGREIMLTLVTDSLGDFGFDWAVWAEPRLAPTH